MTDKHIPNCDLCNYQNNCEILKSLKEARETIFNINREKSGRSDFIYNGRLIHEDREDKDGNRVYQPGGGRKNSI